MHNDDQSNEPNFGPDPSRCTVPLNQLLQKEIGNLDKLVMSPHKAFFALVPKKVISDLKGENHFLSKEIGKPVLKLDFTSHNIMKSLSEFGP